MVRIVPIRNNPTLEVVSLWNIPGRLVDRSVFVYLEPFGKIGIFLPGRAPDLYFLLINGPHLLLYTPESLTAFS